MWQIHTDSGVSLSRIHPGYNLNTEISVKQLKSWVKHASEDVSDAGLRSDGQKTAKQNQLSECWTQTSEVNVFCLFIANVGLRGLFVFSSTADVCENPFVSAHLSNFSSDILGCFFFDPVISPERESSGVSRKCSSGAASLFCRPGQASVTPEYRLKNVTISSDGPYKHPKK